MGQAQQKRRTVLIVEDDARLRSLTAALFEDGQLETIECVATLLIGGHEDDLRRCPASRRHGRH
jgi:hypothetical protein